MKVIFYERYARSPAHIHAGVTSRCYYIPSEKVVIAGEVVGTFGVEEIYLSEDVAFLDEAAAVERGENPEVAAGHGVHFSKPNVLDLNSDVVVDLIRRLRWMMEARKEIKSIYASLAGNKKGPDQELRPKAH